MAFIPNVRADGVTTERAISAVMRDFDPRFFLVARPVTGGFDLNIMVLANAEECQTGKLSKETNEKILKIRQNMLFFYQTAHGNREKLMWLTRLKFFSNNSVALHCPPKKPILALVTD